MVTRNPLVAFGPALAALATQIEGEQKPLGRFIGLDYGKARIGVAVSDTAGRLATARGVLAGKTFAERLDALATIVAEKEKNYLGLVVGFPLNMDGSVGPTGQAAQSFADEVEKKTGQPVLLWDERLTSRQAEAAFFEQNAAGRHGQRFSKKESVGKIDANAAVVMLQSFLDFWKVSLSAKNSRILLEETGVIESSELK